MASSDDTLADASDETYNAMCAKHPASHPDSQISPGPSMGVSDMSEVMCAEVFHAIRSFPCGSAGGPNKLRPQHLKDLIQHVGVEDAQCPCTVGCSGRVLCSGATWRRLSRGAALFLWSSKEEVWGCEANSCGLHPALPRG